MLLVKPSGNAGGDGGAAYVDVLVEDILLLALGTQLSVSIQSPWSVVQLHSEIMSSQSTLVSS
jgi:hypothetical protein